jgi:hypothetical protein
VVILKVFSVGVSWNANVLTQYVIRSHFGTLAVPVCAKLQTGEIKGHVD